MVSSSLYYGMNAAAAVCYLTAPIPTPDIPLIMLMKTESHGTGFFGTRLMLILDLDVRTAAMILAVVTDLSISRLNTKPAWHVSPQDDGKVSGDMFNLPGCQTEDRE